MSNSTDLLDFLRGLFADKSLPTDGRADVVVAGVSSLERHRTVLEQVARHANGVACFAPDFAQGTPGSLDLSVKQLIEARIAEGRGSRTALSLTEHDGMVEASFSSDEESTSSLRGGEREVLGLATMLFSRSLIGAAVAILAYNEDAIDGELQPHVWRFFTQDLPSLEFIPQKVIVLVQMSSVNYSLHLPEGPGLISHLGEDRVQQRQGWNASEPLIRAVAQSLREPERDIVFFLGAGFSSTSGILLGDEFRNKALESLVGSGGVPDLVRRFRSYTRERKRELPDEALRDDDEFEAALTLERVMREELGLHRLEESPTLDHFEELNTRAAARLGRSVTALRDILRQTPRARVVLVTVNFDTLLDQTASVDVFSSKDDFEHFSERFDRYLENPLESPVPLLKLHGTINDRSTIKVSVEDTSSLAEEKTDALRTVISRLSKPRWIYVGYSMRDQDVTDFLRLDEVGTRVDEWWVSPFVNDVCRTFGQRRWTADPARFDARTIDIPSDAFFSALLKMVTAEK